MAPKDPNNIEMVNPKSKILSNSKNPNYQSVFFNLVLVSIISTKFWIRTFGFCPFLGFRY